MNRDGADGVVDLAVGAPSGGAITKPYVPGGQTQQGQVEVFFGAAGRGLSDVPNISSRRRRRSG